MENQLLVSKLIDQVAMGIFSFLFYQIIKVIHSPLWLNFITIHVQSHSFHFVILFRIYSASSIFHYLIIVSVNIILYYAFWYFFQLNIWELYTCTHIAFVWTWLLIWYETMKLAIGVVLLYMHVVYGNIVMICHYLYKNCYNLWLSNTLC